MVELAAGESSIVLLHPPPSLQWVFIGMGRGGVSKMVELAAGESSIVLLHPPPSLQ